MIDEIIVCVSTPTELDFEIFEYWVNGNSKEDAYRLKLAKSQSENKLESLEFLSPSGIITVTETEWLKHEVIDHYRSFDMLDHFFSNPSLLRSQCFISVPNDLLQDIIDKYWSIDEIFLREILNKRLTKSRKDLEECAESMGLHLPSVTRQYENLKRVFYACDESYVGTSSWNISAFLSKNFLFNPIMTRKYSSVIFMLITKFNLTSKRRLQKLTNENLECCASLVLVYLALDGAKFFQYLEQELTTELLLLDNDSPCWTITWKIFPFVDTLELDKQLVVNLSLIRNVLTGEVLDSACGILKYRLANVINPLNLNRIRSIVKSLLQIGASLSQTREYRDLFEDVLTKIAEPLEESGLDASEIHIFITDCYYVISELSDSGRSFGSMSRSNTDASNFSVFTTTTTATAMGGASVSPNTTTISAMTAGMNVSTSGTTAVIPSAAQSMNRSSSRIDLLKKDWLRFIIFIRLCVSQLIADRWPVQS